MKLDIKSIIIIVLLLTSIVFGLKWFLSNDYPVKDDELKKEIVQLDKELKESKEKLRLSEIKSDSLEKVTAQNYIDAIKQAELTKQAEKNVLKYKEELKKARANTELIKENIKRLEDNPSNRTGNSLIESIKNKTK